MPMMPPKPCTMPRCTKYAAEGGRCEEHKHKAWNHKGKTRQERGYGKSWEAARKAALLRDEYLCVRCRKEGIYRPAKDVDHVTPKHLGGTDDLSNLESICRPHHKDKTKQESIAARNANKGAYSDNQLD